jgi:hypothetical protein
MTFNGSNVGIGIISPSYQLDVHGATQSRSGFLSYRTSHFYASGTPTWSAGDPSNWPWVGNNFIIIFTGNPSFGSNMISGMFRVYHSRGGAGNNSAGMGDAIGSPRRVSLNEITDGGLSFIFSSGDAQDVQITIVSYN